MLCYFIWLVDKLKILGIRWKVDIISKLNESWTNPGGHNEKTKEATNFGLDLKSKGMVQILCNQVL
jgi:hypothetical protein